MNYYLSLQLEIFHRHLSESGIPPFLAYILLGLLFVGLSVVIFTSLDSAYAPYVYALLGLSLLSPLSNAKRNDFLKSCFSGQDRLKVRVLENVLCSLPFVGFLLYQGAFVVALLLVVGAAALGSFQLNIKSNHSIPTPFGKRPFEFTIGFRKTFYFIALLYFVAFMAIVVGNFKLAIFTPMMIYFICLIYYNEVEDAFFVWNFAGSPQQFLWSKMKEALINVSILCVPLIVALCVCFPSKILIILGFQFFGVLALMSALLTKYAAFPKKPNVPEGLLLTICILAPPSLLVVVPFLYYRATKKLKSVLNDPN